MRRFANKLFILLLPVAFIYSIVLIFRSKYSNDLDEGNFLKVKQKLHGDESHADLQLEKLWFTNQTTFWLMNRQNVTIFPGDDPESDRIVNQLMFLPPNYTKNVTIDKYKTIFLVDGVEQHWRVKLGTHNFQHCPVSTCQIVNNKKADLAITKLWEFKKTHENQLTMAFILESPFHYGGFKGSYDLTSTYRLDSDIVAPYGKWIYYDENVKEKEQNKNYAANKTHMVAWFVSNCKAKNNRLEIARELQNHVNVDIYGECGDFECSRGNEENCFKLLERKYKFYLAFENSNCRDYVTEKFFRNALKYNILPIVMGGSKADYARIAPLNSFIHVDDFENVETLGDYLNILNANDALYNNYFQWKGTGELIEPHYWCRVCAFLHHPNLDRSKLSLYGKNFYDWWAGDGVCHL